MLGNEKENFSNREGSFLNSSLSTKDFPTELWCSWSKLQEGNVSAGAIVTVVLCYPLEIIGFEVL